MRPRPIPTLLEFSTNKILTALLVKERAKCRKRNNSEAHHRLDKDCPIEELTARKMLSRMMPPRYTWVRPKKREVLHNEATDKSKNAEKALWLTIQRDRKLQTNGIASPSYLKELDAYIEKIRQRLMTGDITFASPQLMPLLKDQKKSEDGTLNVTCRPLSVYSRLDDKIIQAVTSRYLTKYFDNYLHENILSYRKARRFPDFPKNPFRAPDFNDGARMIQEYRKAHPLDDIYASDCDIKKFYDIIPHPIVRQCFQRLLDRSSLSDEGKAQVMHVLEAYLNSYNFYTNVWQEAENNDEVYVKIRRQLHDKDKKNHYQFAWVNELLDLPESERQQRGVPQGGSLSLLIANIVLNDVDQALIQQADDQCLFIRYCDDMILLHTDQEECCRLMDCYTQSLQEHGLYYHDFKRVSETKSNSDKTSLATSTTSEFWNIKSHCPFLWGDGEGNSNRYIGFLGYEIRRDGRMRLRKDNIRRFEKKFDRLFHALRRYKKGDHTPEEIEEHQQKSLDKAIKGTQFYTAFDNFKNGSQYKYLEKLRKRTEKRLG